MKKLIVGARGSRLSLIQTHAVLEHFKCWFPALEFELRKFSTIGDRDLKTDLRFSPEDFFTRELDDALISGQIDFAVHSAKDLPNPVPYGIDWFWLPWREDPRDAWVLPPGKTMEDLPEAPVVGVSSDRREAYCRGRFPNAVCRPVRGSIPSRLEQLDRGDFDALLMAGAALNRLGLPERASEWVPLSELTVPPGQGVLAVTFRSGDPLLTRIRAFMVKAVRFVGAGVGSFDTCTWGGINDLRSAEVCLYDVLMDAALLEFLPPDCEWVFVGKRCGGHTVPQPEITELIANYARQGRRVVRLKGGDPGLFGRLAEEIEVLEKLGLPYTVRPGVSALTVATTGTGMLLTRRGESRGFTALTPRAERGGIAGVALEQRSRLPLAVFMSVRVADQVAAQLINEGWPSDTPASCVFNAGADDERVVATTLAGLVSGTLPVLEGDPPGLLVVGTAAGHCYRRDLGALRGRRILITASEALRDKAELAARDLGAIPLVRPMIRLVPCAEAEAALRRAGEYDWLVLTSPSAVDCMMALVRLTGVDLRKLPKVMTCGPGSAAAFRRYGIEPDLAPASNFCAEGMLAASAEVDFSGQKVLRLRSEKAGSVVADTLRQRGAAVDDAVLYRNKFVAYDRLPEFDAVFFASASAVDSFVSQFGAERLVGKAVTVLGKPTSAALARYGLVPSAIAPDAEVGSAFLALALAEFAP
ncbi:MAG: hydroxymethylbilane synthase [Kiritimatiellae bacterium]|nr:hydroxymethylbilane synthase [Kiritimatiellia bacterium]